MGVQLSPLALRGFPQSGIHDAVVTRYLVNSIGTTPLPDTMEPYQDINIVLLPDQNATEELIQLSSLLTSLPVSFTLNPQNYLPHLSLYSSRYPVKNVQKLLEAVRSLASSTQQFKITLTGYSAFSNYLFFDAEKSKELMSLHSSLVDTVNPLREGLVPDLIKNFPNPTLQQQQAIETYGYISVKELYVPHVTLTHCEDLTQLPEAIALLPKKELTFQASQIAVGEFAKWGTFPSPTASFQFA